MILAHTRHPSDAPAWLTAHLAARLESLLDGCADDEQTDGAAS